MSEKARIDWKDGRSHRDPRWPVGGYAPGKYMGSCGVCGGKFFDMDKYAWSCFPCAVEALMDGNRTLFDELKATREERDALKAVIQIVSPPTPGKQSGEG